MSIKIQNKTKKKVLFIIFFLMIIGGFLRLYKPNWDGGHYLHPDERLYVNASNIQLPQTLEEFLSPKSPLNPHMFYYGEFPLYVYVLFHRIVTYFDPRIPFLFLSRTVSAVISTLTIPLVYLVSSYFMTPLFALLSASIFTFSTASIQHAHFITTETMLSFLVFLLTYLTLKWQPKFHNPKLTVLIGLTCGLSYATKITGLSFAIIPIVTVLPYLLKKIRNKPIETIKTAIRLLLYFSVPFVIVAFLGAPYNLIDYKSFNTEQSYMQGVTYGKYKPPFVIIYEGTLPYLYFLQKVLPYYLTTPLLIAGLLGLFISLFRLFQKKGRAILTILVFPVIYFLWAGMWYAKFARYMTLLVPYFSLFAVYFFFRFYGLFKKNNWVILLSIIIISIVQISYSLSLFYNLYMLPHTRIAASEWIYNNIPKGAKIASEHWDDSLPLYLPNHLPPNLDYSLISLAVYEPDTDEKINKLVSSIASSNYVIFSSRRVYFSILKNAKNYPFTAKFYKQLFDEKLGFKLEKKFERQPKLFGLLEINDDNADETIQSYDHPPVHIFRNINHLTSQQIMEKIKQAISEGV